MNICGILVHSQPDGFEAVKDRLLALPGVEVHGVSDEGRAVVTLETDNDDDVMADSLLQIQHTEGVIAASMIYHHSEEDNEAISEEKLI